MSRRWEDVCEEVVGLGGGVDPGEIMTATMRL
jgi:hypothetical protein